MAPDPVNHPSRRPSGGLGRRHMDGEPVSLTARAAQRDGASRQAGHGHPAHPAAPEIFRGVERFEVEPAYQPEDAATPSRDLSGEGAGLQYLVQSESTELLARERPAAIAPVPIELDVHVTAEVGPGLLGEQQ